MKFIKVKTRAFLPPQDDLWRLLDDHLPKLKEGDIVVIASKILAIHQGRCLKITSLAEKNRLIKSEADRYFKKNSSAKHEFILTIKDGVLIPSAGIDESNGRGYWVLWPKNTQRLLKEIYAYLAKKHKLKKFGLVATDSYTKPLRAGTSGVAIGFYGFEPINDYRDQKDIFGRKLKHTRTNIPDSLAAMAVMLMGEGAERVPLAIVRGADFIKFTNKDRYKKLIMPVEDDIYYPLLKEMKK